MLGLSTGMIILCLGIIFVGATVQGIVGIGMGLIATPLLVAADPAFVPGAILIGVLPLSVSIALRENSHIDWVGIRAGLLGRVPGTVTGAVAVSAMSDTALALTVGVTVLTGVGLSLSPIRFNTTPRSVATAGFASGFGGTAVGIGGPPMALTYQRKDPEVVRSTLAVFFLVGSLISITMLVISGEIGGRETELGLLLIPAVLGGFLLSRVVNPYVNPTRLRPAILLLSAASAATLLITELL